MDASESNRHTGPRRADGSWLERVERGPYKPFPFPVGAVFGRLTVVEWRRRIRNGRSTGFECWCRCECGNEFFVTRGKLKSGHTTRCAGCHKYTFRQNYSKELDQYAPPGVARTRLLVRLDACVRRCEDPRSQNYHNYGARGIRVYPPWVADRKLFFGYCATLPGWDDQSKQLDRIDNDKGYEPGNLRFVSAQENVKNRRTVRQLQQRVDFLEEENARLRRDLRRLEEQVHCADGPRADPGP